MDPKDPSSKGKVSQGFLHPITLVQRSDWTGKRETELRVAETGASQREEETKMMAGRQEKDLDPMWF